MSQGRFVLSVVAVFAMIAGCTDNPSRDRAAGDAATADANDEGTSFNIDAGDENGKVTIQGGSDDGKVRVKASGVDIAVAMPKMDFDSADFDIDGVKLYPGTEVGSINVDASDKNGTQGEGSVRIGMRFPAEADAVADYFEREMKRAKFTVRRKGGTLVGKTDEGDDFTLGVKSVGGDESVGDLVMLDRN